MNKKKIINQIIDIYHDLTVVFIKINPIYLYETNHCRLHRKAFFMSSSKKFSAAQSAQSNEKPTDTTTDAPATVEPVAQPDTAPPVIQDAPKA